MAIKVIYFGVIIPREKVEECKAIGGLNGILEKQKALIGKRVKVDDYLYKDGAMSPGDIGDIVDFWEVQGLVPTEIKDGKEVWKDLCVVDMASGPTLPCDWLEVDQSSYPSPPIVWMKGKPKGEIV